MKNNPLKYIDPTGNIPNSIMAQHIHSATKKDYNKNHFLVDGKTKHRVCFVTPNGSKWIQSKVL
ncbi:hypothetical protein [Paenibacillus alvei]|uniref:hypothetical protein n=1 Tax=Paenibacillus alvei TaxID=44250 RepID=UPI0018CE94BD|nr:hypothetical protein [Paenibacillus alvei]MCY9583009.1 hypothetical protein [Paenibacillus alvei]